MANKDSGFVKLRGQAGLKSVDYYLVVPILSLTFIGLYVLQKVLSNGYAAYPGNFYRQVAATAAGAFAAILICLIDTHFLKLVGRGIYVVSVFLLLLVPIDGFSLASTWGADSWLNLPVIGNFSRQSLPKSD